MHFYQRQALWLSCLTVCACGGDGTRTAAAPWANQRTQVIDTQGQIKDVAPAIAPTDCVYAGQGDVCIQPQDECGDNAADIIVNDKGEALDYICYPPEDQISVEDVEKAEGDIKQNQNGSVIVLDDVDDGVDLNGDVDVDANNVVIYGEGPDTSLISGSINIDGNNTIVRGVRIQGDVEIVKNNAVLTLCVIEGNLTISANNARMSNCQVFGEITVTGNNTEFYGNKFGHALTGSGQNVGCEDNLLVTDADTDLQFSDAEIAAGTPAACEATGGSTGTDPGGSNKPGK
jgi:hypothetical protein